jgi:hypothetical protein
MKTFIQTLAVILAWVVPALAASSSNAEGNGFFLYLFLGFVATIIVFQCTPGLVLFATMVKELFTPAPKKTAGTITETPKET